jgi:hypothetical protein
MEGGTSLPAEAALSRLGVDLDTSLMNRLLEDGSTLGFLSLSESLLAALIMLLPVLWLL